MFPQQNALIHWWFRKFPPTWMRFVHHTLNAREPMMRTWPCAVAFWNWWILCHRCQTNLKLQRWWQFWRRVQSFKALLITYLLHKCCQCWLSGSCSVKDMRELSIAISHGLLFNLCGTLVCCWVRPWRWTLFHTLSGSSLRCWWASTARRIGYGHYAYQYTTVSELERGDVTYWYQYLIWVEIAGHTFFSRCV